MLSNLYHISKCICMYIWVNIYLNLVPRAFCLHGGGCILGTRLHLPYIRLFYLTSAHPLSRIHVLEEYPWRIPASKPEPLRNSSLKNLNFWRIPAWKTWTLEEFQHKKLEPLKNSSLTNMNHWGIPEKPLLSDEGPMLETFNYTIRIGSTPTFLYFHSLYSLPIYHAREWKRRIVLISCKTLTNFIDWISFYYQPAALN